MKVKATKKGYYGHRLRKPGEVFDMEEDSFKGEDGKVCTWVEPADGSQVVSSAPSSVVDAEVEEDDDDDGDAI